MRFRPGYKKGIATLVLLTGAAVWFGSRFQSASPSPSAREPENSGNPVARDFTLLDHNGSIHTLYRESDAKAVVIVGYAPDSSSLLSEVESLRENYSARGVVVWMIDPRRRDFRKELIEESQHEKIGVPILLDRSQTVTQQLGLNGGGQTTVILPGGWKSVFHGELGAELRGALEKILAGNPLFDRGPAPAKQARYVFSEFPQLSFRQHILPILTGHCLNCHSSAGHFPPKFEDYRQLRRWAEMIRETIMTERMPPFSADPYYGHYSNDISLTPKQKAAMIAWIDRGMPLEKGLPENPALPVPKTKAWRQDSPLLWTVKMEKPLTIPPGGTIEYQYFQLGGPAPYDMWVHAIYAETTNPRQLHHESLMITPHSLEHYSKQVKLSDDQKRKAKANQDGDVPLYVLERIVQDQEDPGFFRTQVFAAGREQPTQVKRPYAMFIPKGYYAILEAHYMGTGRKETEQTTLRFYGDKTAEGNTPVHATMLFENNFEIPPGAKSYKVETKPRKFGRDLEILLLLGHLHIRGRSQKLIVVGADGRERIAASIPNFYFAWQVGAAITPVPAILVRKDEALKAECEFDNSATNPNNPDPNKAIRFGQTVDRTEMCLFHLGYRFVDGKP